MPGRVYRIVLSKRMMIMTDKSGGNEQKSFRNERECVDHIFALRVFVKMYSEKDRKLFKDFMDLENLTTG